jgi:hypothetical protein
MQAYLSRDVRRMINSHGDEIELEIFQYPDHFKVTATLCQDESPSKSTYRYSICFHKLWNSINVKQEKSGSDSELRPSQLTGINSGTFDHHEGKRSNLNVY